MTNCISLYKSTMCWFALSFHMLTPDLSLETNGETAINCMLLQEHTSWTDRLLSDTCFWIQIRRALKDCEILVIQLPEAQYTLPHCHAIVHHELSVTCHDQELEMK